MVSAQAAVMKQNHIAPLITCKQPRWQQKTQLDCWKAKGKIGIVGHSQTVIDAVQRVDGFVEKIKNEYPDIEMVDIQYGDGDHLKSAEVTKGMLQALSGYRPDLYI